jgi:protein required for attachment to host cells
MKIKWIVLANASVAHVYEIDHNNSLDSIKLVTTLLHPDGRKQDQDLVADKQGHYQTGEPARGAYSPHTDPKAVETERFAKEIADLLEKNRNSETYTSLILIAAPHFYGLLKQHFHKPLERLVEKVYEKEILINNEKELKNYIYNMLRT